MKFQKRNAITYTEDLEKNEVNVNFHIYYGVLDLIINSTYYLAISSQIFLDDYRKIRPEPVQPFQILFEKLLSIIKEEQRINKK